MTLTDICRIVGTNITHHFIASTMGISPKRAAQRLSDLRLRGGMLVVEGIVKPPGRMPYKRYGVVERSQP